MKTIKKINNRTFNLKKEHLDIQYRNLQKRRHEINQSEYFFSLIEHAEDNKRIQMIKAEMAMPVDSTKRVLIKSKFNKPKINLANYKIVLKEADDYILGENDVIRGILRKIDLKFQKKMGNQIHKDNLAKPFKLSEPQTHFYCDTDTSIKPIKAPLNILTKSNQHKSYFTKALNKELFEVLQKATTEEASFLKTQQGLNKTRRENKLLNANQTQTITDINTNTNAFSNNATGSFKRKYFHDKHEIFYTRKLLNSFPIISKMKEEDDLFNNTKAKLFMNYKHG